MSNTDMVQMANLAKGLAQSSSQASSGEGSFMKFTKFGEWVWGAENTEVEEDAIWAIHPQGFQHGWIGWGDKAHNTSKQKLGEILISATEPLPLESSLEEIQGSWSQQISMQLVCLSGFDKGVKVKFNSSAVGGRNAYASVINEVVKQIGKGGADVCPVVSLDASSYDHTDYGKIFTPVIEVVDWKTLDDLQAVLDEAEADEADELIEETNSTEEEIIEEKVIEEKPKAKAKAKAKAKVEETVEEKPTRQRRTRRTR